MRFRLFVNNRFECSGTLEAVRAAIADLLACASGADDLRFDVIRVSRRGGKPIDHQ